MSEPYDWMAELDRIKAQLADEYADVSLGEQLRLMQERAERECAALGIELKRAKASVPDDDAGSESR